MSNRDRAAAAGHRTPACRVYVIAVALVVGGCLQAPLSPPAPIAVRVARTPADVVRIAARDLLAAGYDITLSDATGGTVAAKRERRADQFGGDVRCNYVGGQGTWRRAIATVTVTGLPSGDSTAVTLSMQVRTVDNPQANGQPSALARPESFDECVSSGVAEGRIVAELQRR